MNLLNTFSPRVRMASAILLCVPAALVQRLEPALLALAFGAGAVLVSGLPSRALALRLLAINGFCVLLWVVLPFSTPADLTGYLGSIGPLDITHAGLRLALLITIKANAIGLAFGGLASAMGPVDVARGLAGLGMPVALTQILFFTQRYVHLLRDEYLRLLTAARARGFSPGFNTHTYRTVAHLVGMVLVRAVDRAESVLEAMHCRGFDGTFRSMDSGRLGIADALLVALSLLAVGALTYLELA